MDECEWIKNTGKVPDCESVDIRLSCGDNDELPALSGYFERYNVRPKDWDWITYQTVAITHYRPRKVNK